MKRILVTSTQYPYYGGAATNSYALIKYFRANGIRTAGVFFDKNNNPVDPDKIGGVWRSKSSNARNIAKRMIIKYLGGRPDIILAKNYAAPIESKIMFPDVKVVYMVTGSPHMIKLAGEGISAQKYLGLNRQDKFPLEIKAIQTSDIVVPNSQLGRKLLIKHYGNLKKITKPIDTSMAINRQGKNIPFDKRKYDIVFIASNLKRDVKNAKLAKSIFSNFNNKRKVIIGNNNDDFKSLKNIKIFNILEHSKVIDIMNNSKLVLCTSFYDASPNTIKEAISSGCNILLSKNCGWSETYPSEFVCNDVYNLKEWINKTSYLINNNVNYSFDISHKNTLLINKIRNLK